MKQRTPCQNCEDRAVGCHSTCEKYKAFRVKQETLYKQRLDRINYNNYLYAHIQKLERKKPK